MSIWKEENVNVVDDKLFLDVEEFFNNIQSSTVLQYRDGQRSMAYSVVDTIKDKNILLIEAGVGIGKSYAYLIPLIKSIQNDDKFEGFIVATSTIALQEQLVNDVKKVAEMLGLPDINVVLAKGKNNYICRKRLNSFLENSDNKEYKYILDEVLMKDTIDHKDFQDISDKMWSQFNVKYCYGMACPYYADCKIHLERDNYDKAKIIITNQDLLIQDMKKDKDDKIFKGDKTIVVDEAHNLEEKIRNSYVMSFDKRYIESLLFRIYTSVSDYNERFLPPQMIFSRLKNFFTSIRSNSKTEIKKVTGEVDGFYDFNRVKFNVNNNIEQVSVALIDGISTCINEVERKDKFGNYRLDKKALNELIEIQKVIQDMLLKEKSKNIYWVDFLDFNGKYISFTYAPKKIDELSSKLFARRKAGMILTSATLSVGDDNYDYYSGAIGLDKVVGKSVLKEFPEKSPYDYDNNALLYCPADTVSPKAKKELYLEDLVTRIEELISITGGKSLVLFTSKSDMNYVFEHIDKNKFDFPIYVQKESSGVKELKEKFESNVTSCLLATGSFYEGVDVKGSSLSQVIITKLPFSVVDPVMDYKASEYADGFFKVYLPDMITKLKQGTGRAIRGEEDTAIISILDPRIHDYNTRYDNIVFESLPFSNITDDIEEVKKFAKGKIK